MRMLLTLLLVLLTVVSSAETPPECKIARLVVKHSQLPHNCDAAGSIFLRAIFVGQDGTAIDPIACQVGPLTWAVGETWTVWPDARTGHKAWIRELGHGERINAGAFIVQDGVRFIWKEQLRYE